MLDIDTQDRKKDVARWQTRIDRAEKKRKEWTPDWELNYKAVFGADWMKDGKRESPLQPSSIASSRYRYDFDLLLAFLKTELPTLVLTRPEVFLNAKEHGTEKNAQAQQEAKRLESRLNAIIGDMDSLDSEIRIMLTDAHCAYAIQKTLPRTTIIPHPDAGQEIIDPQTGAPMVDPQTGQPLMQPEEMLQDSSYEIYRVDPFKFLIDEHALNSKHRTAWVGEEVNRTLEDLKGSGLYDSEIIAKLEDKLREKHNDDIQDWEIDIILYEVYDRNNGKLIVICDDYPDDFLRYEDTPEGIEKDPYTVLKFTEIPGQWFPKPEITSGRIHQSEYRQGREWQRQWAKKANPQIGVKRAFADGEPTEMQKIGDGISDVVVVQSESDVFVMNKDAQHINSSLEGHMSMCMRDFDQTMGQSSQDRGLTGEARFATEANIAEQQGNLRGNDKLQMVKTFFAQGIEKLLTLMKVNPTEPEEIRQTIINVDVDIEIDIESKSPKNKAIDRKQLTEVLSIIAGNPIFMQSGTLLDQILRDYDIRERDKIIQELQQAAQQQAQASAPQPQQKGLNLSLSLKHELLPAEAVDKIVDMIMQDDIPIAQGSSSLPGAATSINPNESVGAGTEGMGQDTMMNMQGAM